MSTMQSVERHKQGIQHFRNGRLEDALQLLGESIAEGETSQRWNDWAAVQLTAHNVLGAEKGLRRALKLEPENLLAAASLGAVLASLGRTEEGIPLLERSWPGLATVDKVVVTNLLLQCRGKSDGTSQADSLAAGGPSPQITQLLSMQTTALNTVALRLIAAEGALEQLSKSLAHSQRQEVNGHPRGVLAQLMHRPSTAYAVTAAAAEGYAQDDLKLVQRLMAAYQHSAAEFEGFRNSMWREFFDRRHTKTHSVFMGRQTDLAAAILRDPASSDLFWGFDNLTISSNKKEVLQGEEDIVMDHLVRFAEAIGSRALGNPMTYLFRGDAPVALDSTGANRLVEQIESTFGCKLSFPNPFRGERGVLTSRGIVSYRAVPAMYQAWRVKQLLKGIARPRVLEIGAGLGRAAYYAWQFGIQDYTIIDIPMTCISSGYFLGRVLGEEFIQLAGEEVPSPGNRIRILPPSHFLTSQEHYDLVLNADSFTELGESVAQDYWNQMKSKADLFLSINHESNAYTVRQFVEKSSRIGAYDRHPYWIHNGYVEETVRFKRPG
jgi:hypothetical protein